MRQMDVLERFIKEHTDDISGGISCYLYTLPTTIMKMVYKTDEGLKEIPSYEPHNGPTVFMINKFVPIYIDKFGIDMDNDSYELLNRINIKRPEWVYIPDGLNIIGISVEVYE